MTEANTSDYVVAPFEADTNVASGKGNVSYEVHSAFRNPAVLSRVNKFIRKKEQNSFAGTWMLVVEWRNVPQPGQTSSLVRICSILCY